MSSFPGVSKQSQGGAAPGRMAWSWRGRGEGAAPGRIAWSWRGGGAAPGRMARSRRGGGDLAQLRMESGCIHQGEAPPIDVTATYVFTAVIGYFTVVLCALLIISTLCVKITTLIISTTGLKVTTLLYLPWV